jgi:hypothetical protein
MARVAVLSFFCSAASPAFFFFEADWLTTTLAAIADSGTTVQKQFSRYRLLMFGIHCQ